MDNKEPPLGNAPSPLAKKSSDFHIGADSHPSLVLVYGRKLVQFALDSLDGKNNGLPLCHRHVVSSREKCLVCELINDIKVELARRDANPESFDD
ncbi:MAG: hypothetical protein K2W95_10690 [Candidatus Obscuribacterales bacterium]|nr:hypothetical protein [Candidatus Obscuribacterales bacterium]